MPGRRGDAATEENFLPLNNSSPMLRKFQTFFPLEGLVGGFIFNINVPLFSINIGGEFGLPGDRVYLEVLLLSEPTF